MWTMFHYGIAGWAMYALLGMAMGYFAYRWGMPLSIRAALYPLLGKRVRGGSATRSTSSPWWAPSSAWPRPWASAWCC